MFLDSFIWSKLYGVRFAVSDGRAIQWLMENDGITGTAMPICSQEDLEHYFGEIVEYFNTVLKKPLYIHLADEEAVMALGLMEQKDRFLVTEQEDLKDYLYDGDAMRSLSGKKLHKKKKVISTDLRGHMRAGMNTDRLCCSDRGDVWKFLDHWREQKGEEVEEHLDYEVEGIHEILKKLLQSPGPHGWCLY